MQPEKKLAGVTSQVVVLTFMLIVQSAHSIQILQPNSVPGQATDFDGHPAASRFAMPCPAPSMLEIAPFSVPT